MIGYTKTLRYLAAWIIGACGAAQVAAAPTPVVPSGPLAAGVQGHWVDVTTSPHNIDEASNALAGAGGFTIARTIDVVHSTIDVGDCCNAGSVDPLSALGDDSFAVRYTGYLHIATDGFYSMRAYHDDGIRVILGGEKIIDFPTDTGPRNTDSGLLQLAAGYYALEVIGWEQGGAFINRFGFSSPTSDDVVIATDLWHDSGVTVPEPATLVMVGLSLFGLGMSRRQRG